MNWVKPALDVLVGAMNIFPGLKTKVGAVLQVVATVMMSVNYFTPVIPAEVIMLVQTAASTLVAVGAANQPANNK